MQEGDTDVDAAVEAGGRLFLNLRNAPCTYDTNDEEDCPFTARYFAVINDDVVAACGKHAPEYWFEGDVDYRVIDATEETCDKHVRRPPTRQYADVPGTEHHSVDPSDVSEPCGAQAAVLIVDPSGEDPDHAACLRRNHSMTTWVSDFGLEVA